MLPPVVIAPALYPGLKTLAMPRAGLSYASSATPTMFPAVTALTATPAIRCHVITDFDRVSVETRVARGRQVQDIAFDGSARHESRTFDTIPKICSFKDVASQKFVFDGSAVTMSPAEIFDGFAFSSI